jgi:hypothetical protein
MLDLAVNVITDAVVALRSNGIVAERDFAEDDEHDDLTT